MEVPGIEGQETKNTAVVSAPETLLTLTSAAEMARLHHVETPIEVTMRTRLLANDGDLYFLQKRKERLCKFECHNRDGGHVTTDPNPHSVRAIYELRHHGYPEAETELELVHQCYLTWLLDGPRRDVDPRLERRTPLRWQ